MADLTPTMCYKVMQFLCTDLDVHCSSISSEILKDSEKQKEFMVGSKISHFKVFLSGLKICYNCTGNDTEISAQCTVLKFCYSDI